MKFLSDRRVRSSIPEAESQSGIYFADITLPSRALRAIEMTATLALIGVGYWLWLASVVYLESGNNSLITCIFLLLLAVGLWAMWRIFKLVDRLVSMFTAIGMVVLAIILSACAVAQSTNAHRDHQSEIDSYIVGLMVLFLLSSIVTIGVANRLNVEGTNLNLKQLLLHDLSMSQVDAPTPHVNIKKRLLGWLFLLLASALLISCVFWHKIFGVYAYLGGAGLLFQARVLFEPTYQSLRDADSRPPVLYLRSFSDDRSFNQKDQWHVLTSSFDFSLEHRLAEYFSCSLGPFIAVANPRKPSLGLGAARLGLEDNEWKWKVRNWMMEAQLIIVTAGMTDGVEWELRQAVLSSAAEKLLIVFPQRADEKMRIEMLRWFGLARTSEDVMADERFRHLLHALEGTKWSGNFEMLWNLTRRERVRTRDLRVIVLKPGGQIYVIHSKAPTRISFQLAVINASFVIGKLKQLTASI